MARTDPPESGGVSPLSAHRISQGGGTDYPSPFFNMASLSLPDNIKELLRYARYYFYGEPLVHAVVRKMASYPITDLIITAESDEAEDKWEDVYDELDMKSFLIQVGLDYFAYGNSFVTPYFPKKRELTCKNCEGSWDFTSFERIRFKNEHFVAECPECETREPMDSKEMNDQRVEKINLMRWDPLNMNIEYNEITGEKTYYYDIPNDERNRIREGKTDYLAGMPTEFIQAAYEDKKVKVNPDMIYHLHRETLAQRGDGWGRPLCYPVMKYLYYLQILRKSQEVIANERSVPKRFLYPDSTGGANPYANQNLGKWRREVEKAMQKWDEDPGWVHTFPFPVGEGALGGDAKALLLTPEINNTIQQIVTGMGVPQEFIFGGLQWTGSSISLRMIENKMLNYRKDITNVLDFLNEKLEGFLDLPEASVRLQDFKMADDMKRKQMVMQLNQQNKVSDQTLLEELDFDFEDEQQKMVEEVQEKEELIQKQVLSSARMKGVMGKVVGSYQAEAKEEMARKQMQLKKEMAQSASLAQQQGGGGKGQPEPANPAKSADDVGQKAMKSADQQISSLQNIGQQVSAQMDQLIGDGGGIMQERIMEQIGVPNQGERTNGSGG